MYENEIVKADLQKLYDTIAFEYGDKYETQAGKYFMWRKINKALELGSFKCGSHLLEIGCANGHYTIEFAKMGFSITGVDLSGKCILEAEKRATKLKLHNIKYITGDAEKLSNISDNSFDGVISFSSFRYFPNPQDAVNELFRVVKKGSNIVIDFPNIMSPWFNYLKPWLCGSKHVHIHDHHYSTKTVNLFLKNAGFKNICIKRILFTPNLIGPNLLKIMKIVDVVCEATPINRFAGILMCKATKH